MSIKQLLKDLTDLRVERTPEPAVHFVVPPGWSKPMTTAEEARNAPLASRWHCGVCDGSEVDSPDAIRRHKHKQPFVRPWIRGDIAHRAVSGPAAALAQIQLPPVLCQNCHITTPAGAVHDCKLPPPLPHEAASTAWLEAGRRDALQRDLDALAETKEGE
jgi:hypothetical protein